MLMPTVFIEPLETIDQNNELVRLQEEEAREVFRILRELTDRLRGYGESIRIAVTVMAALDLIFNDHFSRDEPGIFAPIRETLLERGDYYMHLADLTSYAQAQQRLGELYGDADAWARKAVINVACSGKFSSDRTIAEYAAEIWQAEPCPVP